MLKWKVIDIYFYSVFGWKISTCEIQDRTFVKAFFVFSDNYGIVIFKINFERTEK